MVMVLVVCMSSCAVLLPAVMIICVSPPRLMSGPVLLMGWVLIETVALVVSGRMSALLSSDEAISTMSWLSLSSSMMEEKPSGSAPKPEARLLMFCCSAVMFGMGGVCAGLTRSDPMLWFVAWLSGMRCSGLCSMIWRSSLYSRLMRSSVALPLQTMVSVVSMICMLLLLLG